ncbi:hypothetical protein INT45_000053 [Circinella minor]|uniref:N-acetyltransferase domain-containing protein n=1 Tax=Circinella minor TaxID=1195481 RepID=A0A8H7VHP2_9FUNG|nr:hypothetical protein INT45_000053 [Circinella minor]
MVLSVRRYQDAKIFLSETQQQLEENELDHGFLIWAATKLAEKDTLDNSYCGTVWKTEKNNNEEKEVLIFAMAAFNDDMAFPSLLLSKDEKIQRDAVQLLVQDIINAPTIVKIIQGYNAASLGLVKESWESISPSTLLTTSNDPFWSYVSPPIERLETSKAIAFGRKEGFFLRNGTLIELPLVIDWMIGFISHYEELIRPDKQSESFLDGIHFQCAEELVKGNVYFWCDCTGIPTGMIWRRRPMRYGSSIGYVYTPPEYRGRGYGSAMVAAFSLQELKTYKYLNLLVVHYQNPNNNMYARLGYTVAGTSIQYHISTREKK